MDIQEELVDLNTRCQPSLELPCQETLYDTILLQSVWRSQLAVDPETYIVVDKYSVCVSRTIISPERAKNSYFIHKALHDDENGGRALVPSTLQAL